MGQRHAHTCYVSTWMLPVLMQDYSAFLWLTVSGFCTNLDVYVILVFVGFSVGSWSPTAYEDLGQKSNLSPEPAVTLSLWLDQCKYCSPQSTWFKVHKYFLKELRFPDCSCFSQKASLWSSRLCWTPPWDVLGVRLALLFPADGVWFSVLHLR